MQSNVFNYKPWNPRWVRRKVRTLTGTRKDRANEIKSVLGVCIGVSFSAEKMKDVQKGECSKLW